MRLRARATLSASVASVVVSGLVLGISNTAVTPPSTALREPLSRSSLCSRPGSRKCTCVSMTPGSTCRPRASTTSPASASVKVADGDDAAGADADVAEADAVLIDDGATLQHEVERAHKLSAACLRPAPRIRKSDAGCNRSGETMAESKLALLPDRGVVSVDGPDAAKLLQGVITNDMDLIAQQGALHAGLLSPQGKILFEFFVVKSPDGFCLETARAKAAELAERLKMYKLRADVAIKDASADYTVAAIWGGGDERPPEGTGPAPLRFADPRLPRSASAS